jgi:hypothetical protein
MADIREQTPVSTKGAAGVKGAGDGMRLALDFIKQAEESAREVVKTGESMKARLTKLTKLSNVEHEAFCKALSERRDAIKKAATEAGHKDLTTYFNAGGKDGQIAASVQVTVSLWIKMSIACMLGWKPDTSKPWAVLSKEATTFKKPQTAAKPETALEKQERELKEKKQVVAAFERTVANTLTTGTGESAVLKEQARSALPDVVASVMKWASVEEFDAVIARLQEMKAQAQAAREAMAKAVGKAGAKASESGEPSKQPESEKAEAKITGEHVRTRRIQRNPRPTAA